MALSVVVLGVSVAYLVGAVDLNQGSLQRPGVGFFPLIVAVGLLVAAVVDVVQTARRPAVTDGEPDDDDRSPGDQQFGEAAWRVPVLLGLLVAYFVALPVVGHLAAAAVMCSVVVRMLSAWRWWVSILAGIGVAVGSVLVFEVLLGMRLPG